MKNYFDASSSNLQEYPCMETLISLVLNYIQYSITFINQIKVSFLKNLSISVLYEAILISLIINSDKIG